jgi:hypothetical protein
MLSTVQDTPRTRGVLAYMAPNGWLWLLTLDLYPALVAFVLPWSTSAVSVLIVFGLARSSQRSSRERSGRP